MNKSMEHGGTTIGDLWGRKAADWAAYQEGTIAGILDEVRARWGPTRNPIS